MWSLRALGDRWSGIGEALGPRKPGLRIVGPPGGYRQPRKPRSVDPTPRPGLALAGGGRCVRQQSITPSRPNLGSGRRTRGGLSACRTRRVGGFRPRNACRGRGGRRRVRGARRSPSSSSVRLAHPGLAAGVDLSRRPPRPSSSEVLGRRPSRRSGTGTSATGRGVEPDCPPARGGPARGPDEDVHAAGTGRPEHAQQLARVAEDDEALRPDGGHGDVEAAGLEEPEGGALSKNVDPAGWRLTGRALERRVVLAMIKRRGRGAAALDVLRHVPGDGDHGVPLERGHPRASAAGLWRCPPG